MKYKQVYKTLKYLSLYDFYLMAYKHRVKRVVKLSKKGFISPDERSLIIGRIEDKLNSHAKFMEEMKNE